MLDWNESTQIGKWGTCCTEMDIWESNRIAQAVTPHSCSGAAGKAQVWAGLFAASSPLPNRGSALGSLLSLMLRLFVWVGI